MSKSLTLMTIGFLLAPTLAQASPLCQRYLAAKPRLKFEPKVIAQTVLPNKGSWTLHWHKTARGQSQLIAIQKATMAVRRLNALSGKLIAEQKYSGSLMAYHSTDEGSLVLATKGDTNDEIRVYLDDPNDVASAKLGQNIKDIQLVSFKSDIYAVVTTPTEIRVLKRISTSLDQVAKIEVQDGIKSSFAFKRTDLSIALVIHGMDHRVRYFEYDTDFEQLYNRGGITQLGGSIVPTMVKNNPYILLLDNSNRKVETRVFFTRGNSYSPSMKFDTLLGQITWDTSADGKEANLLIPAISAESGRVLLHINPGQPDLSPIAELPLNDARKISDVAVVRSGDKSYYVYTRDHAITYIQNENEVSIIQAPKGTRIEQTSTSPSQFGESLIAVSGQGASGTVVQIIRLFN